MQSVQVFQTTNFVAVDTLNSRHTRISTGESVVMIPTVTKHFTAQAIKRHVTAYLCKSCTTFYHSKIIMLIICYYMKQRSVLPDRIKK